MGQLIIEQIVSVDGFAEDADGGIGFFTDARRVNDADTEQLRMLEGVEAIVLGARTYRMFAGYWPTADPSAEPVARPIAALPKFVVSNTLSSAPWGEHDEAQILAGDGVASVRRLRERFNGDLIVWGSLTLAHALLRAGAVDRLRLRVLPLLLGRGRSFCPGDPGLRGLALREARALDAGLLVLDYEARGSVTAGP